MNNASPNPVAAHKTPPLRGLIGPLGRSYANWGGHRRTTPAVYVEPIDYADVQTIARDAVRFPAPLRPVGSMMSVTDTIVNDGGTLVCLSKLDDALGLETDARGRRVVRAQAGCRLKKLNLWLQARGMEIAFQAEIGEASVGSVAVGDTKESSLNAPGYFSAHVVEITYVDARGDLITLSDHKDGAAFYEFKCGFGLSGIVVECLIETRPARLCRSDVSVEQYDSPQALSAGLKQARDQCDALLAIVFLDALASFYDRRRDAGEGAVTPLSAQPQCEEFRAAKRLAIQRGFDAAPPPLPKGLVYSRADFVNEYWRPAPNEPRLDFQYYEHDLSRLEEVVVESHRFVDAFKRRTGFAPRGWACYFVRRPERALKPYGLYSDGPGVSFSFDPFHSDPTAPLWREFAQSYTEFALRRLGARASPIQTQWLKKGDVVIPRRLAHPRFTPRYYEEFLD
jgi:hypothetical protein